MPNMPARIGQAMTCLCKGKFATDDDLKITKDLFDNLGKTLVLDESMLDAATAISGSGPGYFYDQIEASNIDINDKGSVDKFSMNFCDAAMSLGFELKQAELLAATTTNGSLALLKMSNSSPGELKAQITSKGGTTAAGLDVLHKGGSLEGAVKAAVKRAGELSKK
ncbi:pyrroline-5-carboxylate reductase family protein [Thermoproteota archaeon]